jgi:hypothetical protein
MDGNVLYTGLTGVKLMPQENETPQLDEAVWQAWLEKNKAEEKLGFVRRRRMAGFVMLFLTAGVLIWRLTS